MNYIKLEDVAAKLEALHDDGTSIDGMIHRGELREALRSLPTDDGVTDEMRKALDRQADNMAFILNRVDLPPQWHDKFTRELAEDRAALGPLPAPPAC